MVACVPQGVGVSLYADDVAVWARNRDKAEAARRVEETVEAIALWSRRSRLTLSMAKCEVGFFSSDSHEARHEPVVSIEGSPLRFNPTPTFLGVMLDRVLSFRPHVKKVTAKIEKRCRLLRSVAAKEWGWSRKTLRMLFLALVRGTLDYCGPAWQPWLAQEGLMELERAQAKAIRVVTGQLTTTPREALLLELRVPEYGRVVEYLAARSYEKARRLPTGHPRRTAAFGEVVRHRTKRGSWRELATRVCREAGLADSECLPFGTVEGPGSRSGEDPQRLSVCVELDGGATRADPGEMLLADGLVTIRRIGGDGVVIYTDGSAVGGTTLGGSAAVVTMGDPGRPIRRAVLRQKGRNVTSSFEAEVTALALAVKWLEDNPDSGEATICVDSQAVLKAVQCVLRMRDDGLRDVRLRLGALASPVNLMWVPSHVGVVGNEWADVEANAAAGRTVPLAEGMPVGAECPVSTVVDERGCRLVSYGAASAVLASWCMSPRAERARVRSVYGVGSRDAAFYGDPPLKLSFHFPSTSNLPSSPFATSSSFYFPALPPSSLGEGRRAGVLLAQLRSGHCARLAAYGRIVNPLSDPSCSLCQEAEPQDLEHLLQRCPALAARRRASFGTPSPPLSVLARVPAQTILFVLRAFLDRG